MVFGQTEGGNEVWIKYFSLSVVLLVPSCPGIVLRISLSLSPILPPPHFQKWVMRDSWSGTLHAALFTEACIIINPNSMIWTSVLRRMSRPSKWFNGFSSVTLFDRTRVFGMSP